MYRNARIGTIVHYLTIAVYMCITCTIITNIVIESFVYLFYLFNNDLTIFNRLASKPDVNITCASCVFTGRCGGNIIHGISERTVNISKFIWEEKLFICYSVLVFVQHLFIYLWQFRNYTRKNVMLCVNILLKSTKQCYSSLFYNICLLLLEHTLFISQ